MQYNSVVSMAMNAVQMYAVGPEGGGMTRVLYQVIMITLSVRV